jgi:hypothetical protein
MPRRALILSSSADADNFGRVGRHLEEAGLVVVELLSDEVLSGRGALQVEFDSGSYEIRVGNAAPFDPTEVEAAWWRKPQWADVTRDDAAQRLSLELELERMHLALADLVPEDAWLNSPKAMRAAESKLLQLQIAAELGFECPRSLVTNDWDAARRTFGSNPVVFKALRGGMRVGGEDRVVFTQRLDLDQYQSRSAPLPYPGLIQEEVRRKREWRVTVVGPEAFPAAVYPDSEGVDWRRDQLLGRTTFASEEIDPTVERALIVLVERLGLRYAAVDLIEDPDGRLVFLEANPNGQYAWLEESLGLQISAAIADLLCGR